MPVFIPLKDFDEPGGDITQFFYRIFSTHCSMDETVFEKMLIDGVFLFLLDGLDEIKADAKFMDLSVTMMMKACTHNEERAIGTP